MKAVIFVEKGRIVLDDEPIPEIGPEDALIRITLTTICGTANQRDGVLKVAISV